MPLKFLVIAVVGLVAGLAEAAAGSYWSSDGVTPTTPAAMALRVQAGDIVVLGEVHGCVPCQQMQLEWLRALRSRGLPVQVGMEFLEYPDQILVDQYRSGELPEAEFLRRIRWGGFPFPLYRDQILFSTTGLSTLALNIPRELSSKVAKQGPDSLDTDERELLPPRWERGNSAYLQRFREAMGDHLPSPEALGRYFWAQSLWDDTMAWRALSHRDPRAVLVIIVGEFHVQYGGGLPDRLRAWGATSVRTLSQVDLTGLSSEDQGRALRPSPRDGARADWIWGFHQD